MDIYETDDPPESPIQQILQSPETRNALLSQLGTLGQKYVSALLSSDKTIDHVYGVYYNDASGMMLGDKSFDIDKKDNIIMDNKTYTGTPGLYELIFKRIPNKDLFTERDQRIYKNILLVTNAHRRGRDPKLPILGNKCFKYRKVYAPLMLPNISKHKIGRGQMPHVMTMTNDKISSMCPVMGRHNKPPLLGRLARYPHSSAVWREK